MDPSTPPLPPSSPSPSQPPHSPYVPPAPGTLPQPPAGIPQFVQMSQDADHLRLLSIFHYVLGGIAAFFGLFPLLHIAAGIMLLSAKSTLHSAGNEAPPPEMGWFFIIIGSVIILVAETMAVLMFVNGRRISARKNLMFCQVVAGIECIQIPFGTALGIFTLLVLQRPSVRALFEENRQG